MLAVNLELEVEVFLCFDLVARVGLFVWSVGFVCLSHGLIRRCIGQLQVFEVMVYYGHVYSGFEPPCGCLPLALFHGSNVQVFLSVTGLAPTLQHHVDLVTSRSIQLSSEGHFLEGGLHFLSWECVAREQHHMDLASLRPCQLPTSGLVCKLGFVAGEGTTPRGPRSVEASDGQFQWHDVRYVAAGGRLRGVSAAGLVLLVGDATCCALLTPPSSPRPWLG